eukprot:m51a1_g12442 putative leucine-rich repeat transmembrane protein flrt1 (717) ;mRNA; f:845664-848357
MPTVIATQGPSAAPRPNVTVVVRSGAERHEPMPTVLVGQREGLAPVLGDPPKRRRGVLVAAIRLSDLSTAHAAAYDTHVDAEASNLLSTEILPFCDSKHLIVVTTSGAFQANLSNQACDFFKLLGAQKDMRDVIKWPTGSAEISLELEWEPYLQNYVVHEADPSRQPSKELEENTDLGVRRERVVWDLSPLAKTGGIGHTLELHALFRDAEACKRVQVLRVSGATSLVSLPLELERLTSLRVLDASCCSLLSVPPVLPEQLRALHLHGNNLAALPHGMLPRLTMLEDLSLGGNNLGPHSCCLAELPRGLRRLSLTASRLGLLPFGLPPSLTFLDLSMNDLLDVPLAVASLAELQTLDLSFNLLREVPGPRFWEGLPKLKSLSLAHNRLGHQDAGEQLQSLVSLERLDVRGNPGLPSPSFGQIAFEAVGSTPIEDRLEAVLGAQGTKLVAVGGAQDGALVFDTKKSAWETLRTEPKTPVLPRLIDHSALYSDGSWIVFGGELLSSETSELSGAAWRVVAYSQPLTVEPVPSAGALRPTARSCHAAAVVNGAMYVFGGRAGRTVYDDLWRLDLVSNEWDQVVGVAGEHPGPRRAMGYCSDSSSLYVLGGEDAAGNLRSDLHVLRFEDSGSPYEWSRVNGWGGEWMTDAYVLNLDTGVWAPLRSNLPDLLEFGGAAGLVGVSTPGTAWLLASGSAASGDVTATIVKAQLGEIKSPTVLL